MAFSHSGPAGGPPPDYFDDPAFTASLFAEADRAVESSRASRPGRQAAAPEAVPPKSRNAKPQERSFGAGSAQVRSSAAARSQNAFVQSGMPPSSSARPAVRMSFSSRSAWEPQAARSYGPAASSSSSFPKPEDPFAASFEERSEEAQKPLTVSAAVKRLADALDGVIDGIWLSGEVADVTISSQGHAYFSLKDDAALVSCVLFRSALGSFGRVFQKGDRIELLGRADVYAPRGRLQIVGAKWRPAGLGNLYEAFLKLKARLEAEGLFASERKKSIPKFVRRIALVTSAQAAAYGDVIRTIERRTPWVRVQHVDAPVQGADAPEGLIAALIAAQMLVPDVILLVRGGGAYEDMQAFNDEGLARTIAALEVPVICGVGHEADFTIADFAADLRASTPTAAAESIGPDRDAWMRRLEKSAAVLSRMAERTYEHAAQRLDAAEMHLPALKNLLSPWENALASAASRLSSTAALQLSQAEASFNGAAARREAASDFISVRVERVERAAKLLASPEACLSAPSRHLDAAAARFLKTAAAAERRREDAVERCGAAIDRQADRAVQTAEEQLLRAVRMRPDPMRSLMTAERRLAFAANALALADPDRPLRAGYARIVDQAGGVVPRAEGLAKGSTLRILFADGAAGVMVEEVTLDSDAEA